MEGEGLREILKRERTVRRAGNPLCDVMRGERESLSDETQIQIGR
jgi:hypothetical protein